jgi:flagellar basal body-associated protein FliL
MKQKNNLLILILIAVVVVLLGIVLYLLVIKPSFTGYAINAQNEGAEYIIGTIFQMASQCQQVPITFDNQTINLVAIECLQQAQQQAPQTSDELLE